MVRVLFHQWRKCVTGVGLLLVAGCAGHYLAQREPWRKEAELTCLQSGAVKESGTIVRIEPINGPGMCGADFPLKVAALGDQPLMGYTDIRPPGSVPNAGPQRWPVTTAPAPRAPAQPQTLQDDEPQFANPARPSSVQRQPLAPSQSGARNVGAPLQIVPQQHYGGGYDRGVARAPAVDYVRSAPSGTRRPSVYDAPAEPAFDDDEVTAPRGTSRSPYPMPPRTETYQAPQRAAPVQSPVPMSRGAVAAFGPVEIKPAATLACPMVSALDRWIIDSVQPAARRWFRQPVVEIRQISAYSCRGMNGQPGARISEHAFGNALDIASFTLADGRKITVKNGWRGSPEEQGFLRDVQGAACDQFNTVLAPGSNRFHYDHFHLDLMRRRSANRICNPDQISGEVVAARVARDRGYAWRPDPGFTGSVGKSANKSRNASLNGRPKTAAKTKRNILDDDDWIEDDGPRPAE
ncbi:extensin family protein [Pseudorhodoplanes sp.]|uniref:extensin-like domain-containing protein n=1 Tax=Pseudorhodoplanes sp. TaxID=1934341 RepID=UPI002D0FA369|nr:extensin family protein [Pseudorhodoplanes sp.]HWV54141.1 extensin family protein [Pseudorhodoplanes sp.]